MKNEGMPEGMSRRDVLRKLLGGALVGAGVVEAAGSHKAKKEYLLKKLSDKELKDADAVIKEAHDFLKERYGVDVKMNYHFIEGGYVAQSMTVEQAKESLGYLIQGLAKYPPDFFERNALPEIRLSGDLQAVDQGTGVYKPAGGVAMYNQNVIVVAYSDYRFDFEHALDHEIFHNLDFREGGDHEEFKEWHQMHDQKNEYPYGDVDELYANPSARRNRWFTRAYGATSVKEDRATVAETLLDPVAYAMLLEETESLKMDDPESALIRSKKIKSIKAEYLAWSGGRMDDEYFELLAQEGKEWLHPAKDTVVVVTGVTHYEYDYPSYDFFEDYNIKKWGWAPITPKPGQ